jgi:hypothetical protein
MQPQLQWLASHPQLNQGAILTINGIPRGHLHSRRFFSELFQIDRLFAQFIPPVWRALAMMSVS